MQMTSREFNDGDLMPRQYTCDGRNASPPLAWTGVPRAARSLALIVEDPDAPGGSYVHWVLFNLPAEVTSLPEGIAPHGIVANGARQGMTSAQHIGYVGPCPPSGTHRYVFTLSALDTRLDLDPGATKRNVIEAMQGHILDESTLIGRYRRIEAATAG
jgi:hypothetical protein